MEEKTQKSIQPPVVMTFAGSDPTSGAGIQADLLTISAIGCHPATVVTTITVQDTIGLAELHTLSPDLILNQSYFILEDVPVSTFKIGLIGGVDETRALGGLLKQYNNIPVVFDPVLSSGAGVDFVTDEVLDCFFEEIIPQTTVLTPNILEARRLVGFVERIEVDNLSAEQCAKRLLRYGCEYVFVTGTHSKSKLVENTLFEYEKGKLFTINAERLTHSYHGSGCTLAAAIAAYIAHGLDVETSVKQAQEYTWQSLNAGYRAGMGQHIPNRFYWRNEKLSEPLNTLKNISGGRLTKINPTGAINLKGQMSQ